MSLHVLRRAAPQLAAIAGVLAFLSSRAALAIPPPPPPPPRADDAGVQNAIDDAKSCFWSNWDKSSNLRFQAEAAVRRDSPMPPEQVRRLILQYVASRTDLKRCMGKLHDLPYPAHADLQDRKAVDSALESLNANYEGQTRFEIAILLSTLDRRAAEEELSFGQP